MIGCKGCGLRSPLWLLSGIDDVGIADPIRIEASNAGKLNNIAPRDVAEQAGPVGAKLIRVEDGSGCFWLYIHNADAWRIQKHRQSEVGSVLLYRATRAPASRVAVTRNLFAPPQRKVRSITARHGVAREIQGFFRGVRRNPSNAPKW